MDRLMRTLCHITALLGLFTFAAAPAGADQILGPGRVVTGTNAVVLPGGPTLGIWSDGKYTATPDALRVGGPGSFALTGGYWPDRPKGANIVRGGDRWMIGPDAAAWSGAIGTNGTSWPWTMGQGIYSYLPRNAQFTVLNPFGTITALFGTRTSDTAKVPGDPNSAVPIGVAALVLNDNAAKPTAAWGHYSDVVKTAGAGDTHNWESDVLNATDTVVRVGPYKQDPGGVTVGMAINAGGEGAPYNNPSNPPFPKVSASSAAIQIAGNGTTFDKAIVLKSGGISPTADGTTVAMDMPANYGLRWTFDTSDVAGAFITSNVGNAANANALFMTDYGPVFRNVSGSEIYGRFGLVHGAVNYPYLAGGTAGQPVQVAAFGSDANVDLQLVPKGAGLTDLRGGVLLPILTPASSSAACRVGQAGFDSFNAYFCVGTNHWKRVVLSDF